MDNYTEEISKLIGTAIDKAKELGGTAKYYALIKAEEAKKQEQYFRMGRKYYDLFKDTPAEELQLYIDRLKLSDSKIAQYKEELKKAENADQKAEPEEEVPAIEVIDEE